MSTTSPQQTIVNCLGAPWPEDLSPSFLDQLREQGVGIVGCTANLTWDDTLESIENFEAVKAIVRDHPHAYILRSAADLDREENRGKVGVLLGLQNPKSLGDSLRLLDAFFDLGLRCLALAFNENSYYGCGYASEVDTGLTSLGKKAIKRMNHLGIVIDLSHSGDRTAMEALEFSEQPVIFSHSTSRNLFNRLAQRSRSVDRRSGEKRRGDLPGRARQHKRRGVCRLDRLLRETRRHRSRRRLGAGRLAPLVQGHQTHRSVLAVVRRRVRKTRLERGSDLPARRHRRQTTR